MGKRISPNAWVRNVFGSKQARSGGIVRRKASSVKEFASHAQLVAAVRARGFRMHTACGQYIIFCTPGPNLRRVC